MVGFARRRDKSSSGELRGLQNGLHSNEAIMTAQVALFADILSVTISCYRPKEERILICAASIGPGILYNGGDGDVPNKLQVCMSDRLSRLLMRCN